MPLDSWKPIIISGLVNVLRSIDLYPMDITPSNPFSEDANLNAALEVLENRSLSNEVKNALEELNNIFPGYFDNIESEHALKMAIRRLRFD